jgi:hypothetical protein
MPRLTAAIVIAAIAVLSGADALRCPDGCTDGTQAAATAHSEADGACLLCTGGIDRAIDQAVAACASRSRRDPPLTPPPAPSIVPRPIEHPPRA